MTWQYFKGNYNAGSPSGILYPKDGFPDLPECPPWRRFLLKDTVKQKQDKQKWDWLRRLAKSDERSTQRGQSFRISTDNKEGQAVIDAVNAAIHLRRPLLVTGVPGSGKTSLAYAIAYELQLGPVLSWPITARSNLVDALYRYDAIARLQDAQLDKTLQTNPASAAADLGDYIRLGPVGTAFLPSLLPRVLLIDEIDKSDLNLPNDLLNLFEEGEFEIPELVRYQRRHVKVRTADKDADAKPADTKNSVDKDADAKAADREKEVSSSQVCIANGQVKCCEFPIVIMTSNGEREFPPAFYRRCLRVRMPYPNEKSLASIVRSHFDDHSQWDQVESLIKEFVGTDYRLAHRATDQLLNAVYFRVQYKDSDHIDHINKEALDRLKEILLKPLNEADG